MSKLFVESYTVETDGSRTDYCDWVSEDNQCLILYGHHFDNDEAIEKAAQIASDENCLTMIDVEAYPTVNPDWTSDMEGLTEYERILATFRRFAPDVRVGYYGIIPNWDYSGICMGEKDERYKAWVDRFPNLKTIYKDVDVIFASAYAFHWPDQTASENETKWITSISNQAKEIRRHFPDKPAYCVLWPYVDSGSYGENNLVDAAVFEAALSTAMALYDGVILWSGIWRDMPKDEQMKQPWFNAINRYLAQQ